MDQGQIANLLRFFPIILISVAIHEFAHCWATDRLGDDTPRRLGRVTLNPLAHLDPMGTIMMVVSSLSGFGFGWGKSSPFNPANFNNPARDRMLTAIAGPLSNLLQMLAWGSIIVLISIFVPPTQEWVYELCSIGIVVNACLAIFNLIPIYPLDGHHLLSYLAPPHLRPIIDNPVWGIVFLVVMFIGPVRDAVLNPILIPAIEGLFRATMFLVGGMG